MFRLTIQTGNDAFAAPGESEEYQAYARDREIARLLRNVAKRLEDGNGDIEISTILDSNGNTVGRWEVK